MNRLPGLPALYPRVRRGCLIWDLVTQRHSIFMLRNWSIQRFGHPVLFGLAKMINEQVAGDGRNPSHERCPPCVVRTQRAIHLDEDFLRKILGIVRRARETIADVIDSPVVALHNLLPGHRVASDTATDQHGNGLSVFQPSLPGTPDLGSNTYLKKWHPSGHYSGDTFLCSQKFAHSQEVAL